MTCVEHHYNPRPGACLTCGNPVSFPCGYCGICYTCNRLSGADCESHHADHR